MGLMEVSQVGQVATTGWQDLASAIGWDELGACCVRNWHDDGEQLARPHLLDDGHRQMMGSTFDR